MSSQKLTETLIRLGEIQFARLDLCAVNSERNLAWQEEIGDWERGSWL